MVLHFVTDSHQ